MAKEIAMTDDTCIEVLDYALWISTRDVSFIIISSSLLVPYTIHIMLNRLLNYDFVRPAI